MKTVCAWCKTELGTTAHEETGTLTYDVCPACRAQFFPIDATSSFQKFLDRIAVPVFIVDHDVRIVAANEKAAGLLGKSLPELEGTYGGEALECHWARLPEGCGNSLHCRTCTIRIMVSDTHATGRSHCQVPAYPDIYRPSGSPTFLISTEKIGKSVVLRIESVN